MEYISYTLLKDANKSQVYRLKINKVPGVCCEYSLVFDTYEDFKQFEHSNTHVSGLGAEIRFGKAKTAAKYLFKIDMKHDAPGYQNCVLVFKANDWVREHIDAIATRLNNQARMYENRRLENHSRR